MAGDWIKMRFDLSEDPAAMMVADRLRLRDPDLIVGVLHKFWCWASRQCDSSGRAAGVTADLIDRHMRRPGFADAMHAAGWLIVSEGGIQVTRFERHNSEGAKQRALTLSRVQRHRRMAASSCNAEHVTPDQTCNAPTVTQSPPCNAAGVTQRREEKRREQTEQRRDSDSESERAVDTTLALAGSESVTCNARDTRSVGAAAAADLNGTALHSLLVSAAYKAASQPIRVSLILDAVGIRDAGFRSAISDRVARDPKYFPIVLRAATECAGRRTKVQNPGGWLRVALGRQGMLL